MARIPLATYRLQLHAEFGFNDAAAVADYLKQLGISHVYCSPYLQAAPGSKHGYDVVDQHRVNEELGGAEAYSRFSSRLGECQLGQVLDIVPNHMAISGRRNRYWWDVLENGPASRFSSYFDIDWQPHEEKLRNKLLVPILGDHYGRVLASGQIQIHRNGSEFFVKYADHELPLAPRSVPQILHIAAARAGSDYLDFFADALSQLPRPTATDYSSLQQRHRDKDVIQQQLNRLLKEAPFVAECVDLTLEAFNRDANKLDDVLEAQNYRLAFWRTAEQDLGYRRFFDVNTLVGIRVENQRVFDDTHALILRWLKEGVLDGIRADHPDGLRDPRRYFERLREAAPEVWILGEKILEPGEPFRTEWPINGTTGYDYLNEAGGLLVDQSNEESFTNIYADFTGESTDYEEVCRDKKQRVLRDLLGSDVNRLTSLFTEICEAHRDRRDYTRHDVLKALRELVACFPVYRTYVVPERNEITEADEKYVNEAITRAKQRRSEMDPELFDFICDVLLLRVRGAMESEFVMRFQQFCGPAMAKGVEDTAFYCFNRLISLNEVGGDPGRFGVSVKEFHDYNANIQRTRPETMLASSTHDTKRSEDVRARISVLSEMPEEWKRTVWRWTQLNEKFKTRRTPDRNTEYLLYQTLVGAWPISKDRALEYMQKATREAKQHTNWLTPNKEFEDAVVSFIESLYSDTAFQNDIARFVQGLVEAGRINSLSLTVLKLTSPGVPDFYQGTEIWDHSLVDPDNRRPVDYELRRRLLSELPKLTLEEILERSEEGLPKLWTVFHTLRVRRAFAASFGWDGDYRCLCASGEKSEHVVGYRRGEKVAVLVTRLPLKLKREWADTQVDLQARGWKNQLTGELIEGPRVQMSALFNRFPVALLTKGGPDA